MKEILRENKEAVRDAGLALIDIGSQLAAGKIDEALPIADCGLTIAE